MEQTNIYDARQFLKRTQVTGKRRVCALTRVSTQHEQQTNALDNQKQWIVEEISRHTDWVFDMSTDLYTDDGISGTSTKKRTGFNEMIEKAKSGKYDLIVTREVCRFMRNAKLTLVLVDELEKYGVEVYFVNDGIWSFNKDDYFKLSIMATYAEQESRMVSQRVFSGQATARANGIHFGNGNILGYKVTKGKKSSETVYEIVEEEAAIVRKIYDLVLQGNGMKKIKHHLEANGYKTSKGRTKWFESTIERIIRNRTYCGEFEYMQSVTIDPLTHERIKLNDRSKRIIKKGNHPSIIEPEVWNKVQAIVDSRVNHNLLQDNNKHVMRGIVTNKEVYCRKMRCGCGRRFKKDLGRKDDTGTYRCYGLIADGSQEKRREKSLLDNDNCFIDGIIDWKLDLFTLKVFETLNYNIEEIKTKLVHIIEKAYVGTSILGYNPNDKLKIHKVISDLNERLSRLIDLLADGIIDKQEYQERKKSTENEKASKEMMLKEMEKIEFDDNAKIETLNQVKAFVEKCLEFPSIENSTIKVPERMIETYVNSIKACANNIFEYNIRVNPNAKVDSPLVCPDEEYNPLIHPATKKLDNSKAILLKEFQVEYAVAKEYANKLKRKVVRVHWDVPATIKIFASL
jgi:DNA invertase Pin-like site-specific DNA recombinase